MTYASAGLLWGPLDLTDCTGHRQDSCENGRQAQCGGKSGDIRL